MILSFEDLKQRVNVQSGVASVNYRIKSDAEVGDFTLSGKYIENDTYMESTDTANFKTRIGTRVSVPATLVCSYGSSVTVTATVETASSNVPVDSGIVEFSLNNQILGTANVVSGSASYTISEVLSSYNTGDVISAVYKGTSRYGVSSTLIGAELSIREGALITINNTIANRGTTAVVEFTITDEELTPLSGEVNVYIDNVLVQEEYAYNGGTASINYPVPQVLNKDSIPVRVVYLQNDSYDEAEQTAVISLRRPVSVSVNNISANAGSSATLTITVTDTMYNVGTNGGQVAVKIGTGSVTNHSVGNDGVCQINYNVPANASGTIQVKASYIQNDNYEAGAEATGIITIRKAVTITVTDIIANIGDTVTLTAQVQDGNNPVTTGEVEFEIVTT